MKRKRYTCLEICALLIVSIFAPATKVFAEPMAKTTDDFVAEEQAKSSVIEEVDELAKEEQEDAEEASVEESEKDIDGVHAILIKSYNPGFSDPYVGEYFELIKLSKSSILLAGLSVLYETSTGSEYTVYEFSEGHEMVGESLLMRLASSREVTDAGDAMSVADATYTRNMSQSGGRIKLKYDDEVIDSLCWGLKETGCYEAFSSKKPTTLVREIDEEEIGDFVHRTDYILSFDADVPGLKYNEPMEELAEPKCREIEFSEILTYYENASTEQFIELYNHGEETADLGGCFIKYKNNNYALTGSVEAHGFAIFYPTNAWHMTLTKNPTSFNRLDIIDTDGEIVDELMYYSGQKRGLSLAKLGYKSDGSEKWEQTYNPTPGIDNIYQQFKTCPIGKALNLDTGNCVNETPIVATLAACPEGKYRNPLTGRCKSYTATTASTQLKPCTDGYERNPETNRCRKIRVNNGTDYPVATGVYEDKKEFVSVWAIATVIVAGLGYIVFQYKDELKLKFARQ
ncbi:hypothetical protein IKG06_02230 [Candidatus Saccharibacteria bacterium]|nr:hypothetical protein [Candidatus Saccharibacteria bacterium]